MDDAEVANDNDKISWRIIVKKILVQPVSVSCHYFIKSSQNDME